MGSFDILGRVLAWVCDKYGGKQSETFIGHRLLQSQAQTAARGRRAITPRLCKAISTAFDGCSADQRPQCAKRIAQSIARRASSGPFPKVWPVSSGRASASVPPPGHPGELPGNNGVSSFSKGYTILYEASLDAPDPDSSTSCRVALGSC